MQYKYICMHGDTFSPKTLPFWKLTWNLKMILCKRNHITKVPRYPIFSGFQTTSFQGPRRDTSTRLASRRYWPRPCLVKVSEVFSGKKLGISTPGIFFQWKGYSELGCFFQYTGNFKDIILFECCAWLCVTIWNVHILGGSSNRPQKKAASLPTNIPWSKVPGTSMKGMPDKMAAVKTLVTGMLSKPSLGKTASSADAFRISPKEASSLCETN